MGNVVFWTFFYDWNEKLQRFLETQTSFFHPEQMILMQKKTEYIYQSEDEHSKGHYEKIEFEYVTICS